MNWTPSCRPMHNWRSITRDDARRCQRCRRRLRDRDRSSLRIARAWHLQALQQIEVSRIVTQRIESRIDGHASERRIAFVAGASEQLESPFDIAKAQVGEREVKRRDVSHLFQPLDPG